MIKQALLLLIFILMAMTNIAQNPEESFSLGVDNVKTKAAKSERLVVDFFTDFWQKKHDSIKPYGLNRGFSFTLFSDHPIGTSNFAFGWGLNVSAHNLYSDAYPSDQKDTATHLYSTSLVPLGYTTWYKIPSVVNGKKIEYSINKLTLAYFEIPLELRFKNRQEYKKRFKIAAGAKFGVLMSSHTKYVGDDFNNINNPSHNTKIKVFDIPYLSTFRYGITARMSIGYIGVNFYYGLNPLFEKNKGSEMFPISVGISVIPF